MPDDPKQYVVAQLQEALAHDPRVNELDVHVKVVGDKVFLRGCVSTPDRIEAITAVAGEVLPDHDVHNEVAVMSYDEPDGMETLS
jgi:osmotically-inducible protein OsmY